MNEPITWGDYFLWKVVGCAVAVLVSLLLGALIRFADAFQCHCGRTKQWRWWRPSVFARHLYCVRCEQETEES